MKTFLAFVIALALMVPLLLFLTGAEYLGKHRNPIHMFLYREHDQHQMWTDYREWSNQPMYDRWNHDAKH